MQRKIVINKGSAQVTLPKAFTETLHLEKGDRVNVTLEGSKIVIAPFVEEKP